MPRISRVAKVWFGMLLADAALTVWEDRKAAREADDRVHGYPWSQARDILEGCWKARPDIYGELPTLSDSKRNAFVCGVFGMSPARFREVFGFDRPATR